MNLFLVVELDDRQSAIVKVDVGYEANNGTAGTECGMHHLHGISRSSLRMNVYHCPYDGYNKC